MKEMFPSANKRFLNIDHLLVILLIVLILPLNILFIYTSKVSENALLSQAHSNITSILDIYTGNLDVRMTQVDELLTDFIQNNTNFSVIRNRPNDEYYTMHKFFLAQDMLENTLPKQNGDVYFMYNENLQDTLVARRSEYSDINTSMVSKYITEHYNDLYRSDWQYITVDHIPYLARANQSGRCYVGCMIRIDRIVNELCGRIDQLSPSEAAAQILVSPSALETARLESQNQQFFFSAFDHSDCLLSVNLPTQSILSGLSFFQQHTYALSLIYLAVIPILLIFIGFLLLRPLHILYHAMQQLEEGRQEYRIPSSSQRHMTSEFHSILQEFNTMSDSIQNLTIKNYEHQLARQQVELDNLQLTIRPHFLQNSFGILFTLCQMGENDKLGTFILYLSNYFRYIYQSLHQIVPFSSELQIIREFVEIKQVQYSDFTITYELPANLNAVNIPPLLIHNFIENTLSHGIKRGRHLNISLHLEYRDQLACFTIKDDGIGIAADVLSQINQGMPIQDGSRIHVGLYILTPMIPLCGISNPKTNFNSQSYSLTPPSVIPFTKYLWKKG